LMLGLKRSGDRDDPLSAESNESHGSIGVRIEKLLLDWDGDYGVRETLYESALECVRDQLDPWIPRHLPLSHGGYGIPYLNRRQYTTEELLLGLYAPSLKEGKRHVSMYHSIGLGKLTADFGSVKCGRSTGFPLGNYQFGLICDATAYKLSEKSTVDKVSFYWRHAPVDSIIQSTHHSRLSLTEFEEEFSIPRTKVLNR